MKLRRECSGSLGHMTCIATPSPYASGSTKMQHSSSSNTRMHDMASVQPDVGPDALDRSLLHDALAMHGTVFCIQHPSTLTCCNSLHHTFKSGDTPHCFNHQHLMAHTILPIFLLATQTRITFAEIALINLINTTYFTHHPDDH